MSNKTEKENPTAKAVILAGLKKILSPKEETSFVDFIKQNNLRCLRSKQLDFGTRISVIKKEGKEVYAYGKNFHEAFSELKRKFGSV